MLDRLKSFFASGLFLATAGLGGAFMLTWPLVSIPSQGSPSHMPAYIYCVWTGLICAAALWALCQPPEKDKPPERTATKPSAPSPSPPGRSQ